jgi:hypothetical protein
LIEKIDNVYTVSPVVRQYISQKPGFYLNFGFWQRLTQETRFLGFLSEFWFLAKIDSRNKETGFLSEFWVVGKD